MTLNLPNTIRDNPPGTCRIYRFNNKGEAIPVIRRRKFDMLKLSEISQVQLPKQPVTSVNYDWLDDLGPLKSPVLKYPYEEVNNVFRNFRFDRMKMWKKKNTLKQGGEEKQKRRAIEYFLNEEKMIQPRLSKKKFVERTSRKTNKEKVINFGSEDAKLGMEEMGLERTFNQLVKFSYRTKDPLWYSPKEKVIKTIESLKKSVTQKQVNKMKPARRRLKVFKG